MNNMNMQERISALADGQLRGDDLDAALQAATADPAGREVWHCYHLIGDVLRSEDLAAATPAARFLDRLHESLKAEQIEPARRSMRIEYVESEVPTGSSRPAVNDARPWKYAAGAAALAAVAAISWSVVGGSTERAAGPQLAANPAAPAAGFVLAGSGSGPMIRDERLDSLMAAHRQFGGATALQTPAPFVRNASFEGPAR